MNQTSASETMKVIYEVNLAVAPDQADALAAWLPGHVEDMLALPGFVSAEIAREDRASDQAPAWSIRYHLANREALDRYLLEDAQRMRAEGLRRFGKSLSASRRILTPSHLSASM